MGVASGCADAMAVDAQRFPCASMAARAKGRISPGSGAVIVLLPRQAQPSSGMWALAIAEAAGRSHTLALMALAAGSGGMAADAKAGLPARFLGVPGAEACAVNARANRWFVKGEAFRQCGCCISPMASETEALGMASCTHLRVGRSGQGVRLDEAEIVDQMVFRLDCFGRQIDVAGIAAPRGPLVLVGMAAQTCGHARAKCVALLLDVEMAAHAITAASREVFVMREA